jgi:anti-sigma regulatory factor (Ser/Thr protein kinase)
MRGGVVHTHGHAQAMISARPGVTPAFSVGSAATGTAAPPPAMRSLRRTFRGEPAQVPLAREFVFRYLDGRHCPAEAVQDILVCATELAANAVLHSRSGLPGGHFSVEVVCAGQSVHVAVEDSGGPWTERGHGSVDEEYGRGLQVVSALSADMGIAGDASGRMAWFCCHWSTSEDDQPQASLPPTPSQEMACGNLEAGKGVAHPAVNASKPNVARIYDYLLGGKDNFAADRTEAERLLQVYPLLPVRVRENRLFLARAVNWIADRGIRQFVDIGSGLPTAQNTHQIAQAVDPACRVAYVDYDPVVVTHARARLSANGVTAIESDLRDPAGIVSHPDTERVIRLGEPLGLILGLVLHFIDAQAVSEIMRTLVRAIAPGSYVVISVESGDEQTGDKLARAYTATTLFNHAPGQIARFFDGLEVVDPGLVDARTWEPLGAARQPTETGWRILAGVGRKS